MFSVIIVCAFDVVYTVAKGLEKMEAIDLANFTRDSLEDECYEDLFVKEVKVVSSN
jgi:hypothetical protein